MGRYNDNEMLVFSAYRLYGRQGFGKGPNQIDTDGHAYWVARLDSGELTPETFMVEFEKSVRQTWIDNPKDKYAIYTEIYQPGAGGNYDDYLKAKREAHKE